MASESESPAQTRAGFVAVIGAPNAGKSTLVNALVGEKVSIVTHKVQTTRFAVRGVAMHDDAQIVLVDTPGVFEPRRRLDRAMVAAAWTGADDADAVIHVVDAAARDRLASGKAKGADKHSVADDDRVVEGLKAAGKTAVLALNKVDLMPRERLLEISKDLFDTGAYSDVFMISAQNGSGVKSLKAFLAEKMTPGPYLYPEDQAADIPQQLLAAEITREKVYLRLHEELPYASMVETEVFKRLRDGSVRIEQSVIVERDSQKPIVLGKGGRTIKDIGEKARAELEDALQTKVHLFLNVKVDANWMNRRGVYADVGLDFDAG